MLIEIPPKKPNQTWMSYQFDILNNFFLYFPMGREPFDRAQYPEEGYYLGLYIKRGVDNSLCEWKCYDGQEIDCQLELKTKRQFVQEIWDTAIFLGFNLSDLGRKLNEWYLAPHNAKRDDSLDEEVCMSMIKIYKAMLEKGYPKANLVR